MLLHYSRLVHDMTICKFAVVGIGVSLIACVKILPVTRDLHGGMARLSRITPTSTVRLLNGAVKESY